MAHLLSGIKPFMPLVLNRGVPAIMSPMASFAVKRQQDGRVCTYANRKIAEVRREHDEAHTKLMKAEYYHGLSSKWGAFYYSPVSVVSVSKRLFDRK
jgi:hypothetical protein